MSAARTVPAKPRWKAWRRRIVRGIGLFLTLVIVSITSLLVAVHTDYGREEIRSRLESELDGLFVGDVKIDRIEGSLLSEFAIVGVSITDAQQLPAVSVGRIEVGYAPLSLWNRTVDIESLVIRDLQVQARRDPEGLLNLAQLLETDEDTAPETEENKGAPSPWRVLAPNIQLRHSEASLTEPWGETRARQLQLDADVAFADGELSVRLTRLSARWQPPAPAEAQEAPEALPLSLRAELRSSSEGLAIDSAALHLGAGSATVTTLTLGSEGATNADLALFVPAEIVRRIDPESGLLVDVALALHGERQSNAAPIAVNATGTLGTSPLALQGRFSPETQAATVHLEAKALDAGTLWRGLTPSLVDLSVDGTTEGFDPNTLVADATVAVSGQVDGTSLGALSVHGTLKEGLATASLEVAHGPKWIEGRGSYKLATQEIVESQLHLDQGRIQAFTGKYVEARGDLRVDASARGHMDNLLLEGSLSSRRLAVLGNRSQGLRAKWSGQVGGGRYAGTVSVKANGLNASGTEVGSVTLDVATERPNHFKVHLRNRGPRRAHRVDLTSTVTVSPRSTDVDIGTVLIATRGLQWKGRKGRIVIGKDDDLEFHNIALDSDAGHLLVDGGVQLRDGKVMGADLELAARYMDLAALGPLVQLEPTLQGQATLTAQLRKQRGRKTQATVHVALQDVGSGTEVPTTTGTLELALDHRNLTFGAALQARGVGTIAMRAQAIGPRNALALPAWKRLDESALLSAHIETSALDLSKLSRLNENLPTSGLLTLTGGLEAGGARGELVIKTRDLVHPKIAEPANAELRLALSGNDLHATGEAAINGRVRAIAEAAAILPGPLLRPATLAAIDHKVLQEATVAVDNVDLSWWDQTLALGFEPANAQAELDLVIAKAAQSATLTVRAGQDGTDAEGKSQERFSELIADVTAAKTVVTMRGTLAGNEAARGNIDLDAGWDLLLAGDPTAIANTPIRADLNIVRLPLALLHETLVKDEDGLIEAPKGDLVASATIGGTLSRPIVAARAHTENGVISGIEFSTLRVDGTYRDEHLVATVAGQQKAGGRLQVRSDVNLVPTPITRTTLEADKWDLGFLATVVPERSVGGLLSANLQVSGPLEKPSIVGTGQLEEGSVHPGAPLYTLRDLDMKFALTPTKLTIQGQGSSGRGEVTLDGRVAIADLLPQSLSLDVELRRLPVEAGPLSIFVDSKTAVRGKRTGANWRFDVDVGDTVVAVPGETSRTLHPDVLPGDIVFVDDIHEPPPGLVAAILPTAPSSIVDVYIRAPETITVRGEPVRTIVDVDLHARLASELVLEGTVATRGGWIELFDRRYELRRGDIGFSGSTDPALDVELTHDFAATTLTIAVAGTGKEPQLALRSDPSHYDDSELLSFVLGASPDDDRTEDQTAAGRATGAASNYLAGKLQAVVRNVVPIDVLKIEVADTDAAAERLTVGKWLTDKIFLAYRRRFESQDLENDNEAVIEYRFKRRWLLELSYGDQGTGGADVLWLKRF